MIETNPAITTQAANPTAKQPINSRIQLNGFFTTPLRTSGPASLPTSGLKNMPSEIDPSLAGPAGGVPAATAAAGGAAGGAAIGVASGGFGAGLACAGTGAAIGI